MSLCINNDLIWVSIPKCASTSIEYAFYNSGLNVEHYYFENAKTMNMQHTHIQLNRLYDKFGFKETVCVKKDYFDRWLSALRFFWGRMEYEKIEPIVPWESIDNDFIYTFFNQEYIDKIYTTNLIPEDFRDPILKTQLLNNIKTLDTHFFKDKTKEPEFVSLYVVFYSQSYWLNSGKCDHEFDITEIDKFESFISDRYSIDFKLPALNKTEKIPNKMVIDEELKKWVFDNFEKRFVTKMSLI